MATPVAVVVGETLPHAGEHAAPLCVSVQLTLGVTEGSFITVAVNVGAAVTTTVAVIGETETVMAGTVIVVEADFVESAAAVAVMVSVKVLAGGPGAV